ncbi:N-glycosylase [Mycobacterium phage Kumao]|uniref:N-glycosylase n=1 Tax=Mycobacterium phage Kumao TaxID=2041344 RepID=A0A2D1GPY4_9CAUD|nr:N-glycosylase [Mycobacterium phage Kumao]ATN94077.1 N-glycosylase [Mycobacterium phage Kumao]
MARARKSDSLSVEEMAIRISTLWESAEQWMRNAGASWYVDAHTWAERTADETGHTVEQVAAVIAAYSPRTRWIDNLLDADNLLRGKDKRNGVMAENHKRALRILASDNPVYALRGTNPEKLTAPKIWSFAQNILGNGNAVTVDIWAARAALGDVTTEQAEQTLSWAGAYERISDAYRKAAANAGVAPSTMQAAVWIAIRGKAD